MVAHPQGRVLAGLADREQLDRPAAVLHLFHRPAAGRRAHPRLHVPCGRPGRRRCDAGFFVVGTACWPFVVRGMMGTAYSLISDREHWRTLRYVYISPISLRAYLVGRALAQATSAVAAAAVTLVFGRWVLGVPMHLATINAPYTAAAFVLGIGAVIALGLIVVSAAVLISGEAWRMPEGVGAALYLVCGAIFPVTVLPPALQALSQAIPLTWWLEAMRRGLLGPAVVRSLPHLPDPTVLGFLAMLTALWVAAALVAFTFAERRARQLGILDRETMY